MDSLPDAGMPKGPSPSQRVQRSYVLYSLCGVLKRVHWQNWEEPQAACQHRHALKNGDIQVSTLAEHVFKTRHAVNLSQSEMLHHH